ncbi:nodulin-26-like [Lycium barbarum]|uniref:nodulin-26-like n=1 Tax=Lycium barbarum TaxID=112863 RepID=UPI00293EE7EC|nr:nodulin-26-like [Lycium barbarum]
MLKGARKGREDDHDIDHSIIKRKRGMEIMSLWSLHFHICGLWIRTIVDIALGWGLSVIASIYTLGHISGAHFNPAVTIAFAAARKLPLLRVRTYQTLSKSHFDMVPIYALPQFLGSTLASLTLRVLFNHQEGILPTLTQYKSPVTDFEALTWEFLMTLILMSLICGAATDDRGLGYPPNQFTIFNCRTKSKLEPITGASRNPARSLGPAIVSGVYKNQRVFVIVLMLGAMTATG